MHSPSKHIECVSIASGCHHFAVWVNIYKFSVFKESLGLYWKLVILEQAASADYSSATMTKWEGKAASRQRQASDFPTEYHTRASTLGKLSAGFCQPCCPACSYRLWHPGQNNHYADAALPAPCTLSRTFKRSLKASDWPRMKNSFLFEKKFYDNFDEDFFWKIPRFREPCNVWRKAFFIKERCYHSIPFFGSWLLQSFQWNKLFCSL